MKHVIIDRMTCTYYGTCPSKSTYHYMRHCCLTPVGHTIAHDHPKYIIVKVLVLLDRHFCQNPRQSFLLLFDPHALPDSQCGSSSDPGSQRRRDQHLHQLFPIDERRGTAVARWSISATSKPRTPRTDFGPERVVFSLFILLKDDFEKFVVIKRTRLKGYMNEDGHLANRLTSLKLF